MDIPEPVFSQPKHYTIAGNAAAIVAHQAITPPVNDHGADWPREHVVKERRCVWATNFQWAFGHIERYLHGCAARDIHL